MFVKSTEDQTLIKVTDVTELIDPMNDQVQGQLQDGQEEQPPQTFEKSQLQFPSGEALPQCWIDPDYQLK
ncbi:MAG TPA: acetyltransferase [Nodosilinea sp.]|jgi:hypothetical protein|nr:acetyltransferase [Nodosilinea sp.]